MPETLEFSRFALNRRILSVVMFTFVSYLSIGLPLAVLPGLVHQQLGFNSLMAGIIISLQYFSTLISRPQSGRLADKFGPKRVVMLGLLLCALSGLLTLMATWLLATPGLSLGLLALGRVCLGFGESFGSTGSTLWGMNLVGPHHTARVISWNGVATYLAMAIGAPLGVILTNGLGYAGFTGLIILLGVGGFILASRKAAVVIDRSQQRVPFTQVLRAVFPYGLGLGLGTLGFGVIATFITLYFSSRGWQGAALTLSLYSLGFVVSRFIFNNVINRYGGLKVSFFCLVAEAIGLFVLWQADSLLVANLGALMTGAGFSLVFPALGVEAVKQVQPHSQGSALGTYSAFLDLGLGLSGPVAGLLMSHIGIRNIYLVAAAMGLVGGLLMILLIKQRRVTTQ